MTTQPQKEEQHPKMMSLDFIRHQLLAYTGRHEKIYHNSARCLTGRIEAIAFLAHALGVDGSHMGRLLVRLDEFTANFPCQESRTFGDSQRWVEHADGAAAMPGGK